MARASSLQVCFEVRFEDIIAHLDCSRPNEQTGKWRNPLLFKPPPPLEKQNPGCSKQIKVSISHRRRVFIQLYSTATGGYTEIFPLAL